MRLSFHEIECWGEGVEERGEGGEIEEKRNRGARGTKREMEGGKERE
jgi:hypothetical protein